MVRLSPARIAAYSAAALSPLAVFALIPSASAAPAPPPLRLVAAAKQVTLYNSPTDPTVSLELGTHLIAGAKPFEVRATRASYHDPILARQVVNQKPLKLGKPLPANLIDGFNGFAKFLHVTIADSAGKKVAELDQAFCPGGETARTRPDAPAASPYPWDCGGNAFAVGSVWGIQAGWSSSTFAWTKSDIGGVKLSAGSYTAAVSINKPFLSAFGIPADQATASVKVKVETIDDGGGKKPHGLAAHAGHGAATASAGKGGLAKPAAAAPSGTPKIPAGPRPDLRPLPAYGISIVQPDEDPNGQPIPLKGDFLGFGADVWNAGNSALVVDGFRPPGAELMDAYQYFFDANGKQTGWAPAGKMEYDNREGHKHWHFRDFARYRLVTLDKKTVVTSQKEAFCLAATDGIDLTVPNAQWRPNNTSLGSACGGPTALAMREYLDVGWGDTYTQDRPGQAFDITKVPNGTYYIEVTANPAKKLYESNTNNNTSYRKVILGGKAGARTVTTPPYELIDAP